jgi:RNA polymerase sigma factor (sigma-70 family)
MGPPSPRDVTQWLQAWSEGDQQALEQVTPLVYKSLDNTLGVASQPAVELVGLHDALNALAQLDPRKRQVVELRFFGGLSVEETAEVLKVSAETVMRDWKLARAWLRRELCRARSHEA